MRSMNRLTFVSRELKDSRGRWMSKYKCTCGIIKLISESHVNSESTKSCGCLKSEYTYLRNIKRKKEYGKSAESIAWSRFKTNCKNNKKESQLTKEIWRNIVQRDCHYCGRGPSNVVRARHRFGDFICNGIDRINSSFGYLLDNVVPCCSLCNFMKRERSQSDFINHIIYIYDWTRAKNLT